MQADRIGPYRILGDLGSGGMGKVYLGEVVGHAPDLENGAKVALKVIHPHLFEAPGFFKRFLREAEIGQSVRQDNVVRCYDCDALMVDGQQLHFLVMEYVEGQTLRDLLNELERVPEELCRHIGREIAKALVAVHEAGAVHRDIKPENVLITEDHVVKLMDLGVARLRDAVVRLSPTGTFIGSIEYAPPEQLQGREIGPTGDLYSLGILLYELATGRHPHRSPDAASTLRNILDREIPPVGEVNPQLSPFFEEVIQALTAKEPDERFPSADVLLDALEAGEGSTWWTNRARVLSRQTKRPLRRIRIPRETALYGRDDDLARLRALYDRVKEGHGQVLLVEGEAGIGKTRVVDEFVGRLLQEGEDLHFLFGSYPPGGAATASGAFSTAYREQFGAEGLEETLEHYLAITPVLIPAFAALLKGEPPPEGAEPLTKDSLQTAFVHATRTLASERPTVVMIDDLHFAPGEGRALFASLALATPEERVLLVGTMRPGVPQDWIADAERPEHASRTVLARLGPKDLARLLEDAFHSERLATELGHRIALKCDGNPFFAFEIIRGLKEGRFITRESDGTWVTTQTIQNIQVPSSVLDLVNARVADLEADERDLLDLASCCGFDFDPLLVARTAGADEIEALKQFGRIEKKHQLVRSSGRRFVFDHHQVQEALYSGLSEPLRERYHAAVAEALEAREDVADADPQDVDGALCVDLCEHALRGAQAARARRYLDAALDHLAKGYLTGEALALADRALDADGLIAGEPRARLLLRKANWLDLLGRWADQKPVLDEAAEIAEQLKEPGLLSRTQRAWGIHLAKGAAFEEARDHFTRAAQLARVAGDRKQEANAERNIGTTCRHLGGIDEARRHFESALAMSREIGDRAGETSSIGNLGIAFTLMGRHDEARRHFEHALALCRERDDRADEVAVIGNLGVLLLDLGRYVEAQEALHRKLVLSREIGYRKGEVAALGGLAGIAAGLGRYAEARSDLDHYLHLAVELGDPVEQGYALLMLGVVAEEEGDLDRAERFFAEVIALRRRIDDQNGSAHVLLRRGRARLAQGDAEAARSCFREARELGGDSLLLRAHEASLPDGDVDAALAALDEEPRLGLETRLTVRHLLWKATRDRAHLEEAKRLLDRLVEHAPEEYRESMLQNVRLRREIMAAWSEHGDTDT